MGNITITLLTSKRTRQTIDALDSVVAAQAGGYVVVEGENDTTVIDVNYPGPYSVQTCYVYMKNARGEYETKILTQVGSKKTFTLPSSMTYKGNTYLTFYAEESGVQTVWLPVVVPVAETGVDYMKAATTSEDVIRLMLEAAQKAASVCEQIQQEAENGEFNGNSVFVRYSQYPDGHDMSQTWNSGENYIGFYTGIAASNDYKEYSWSLFVGGANGRNGALTLNASGWNGNEYTVAVDDLGESDALLISGATASDQKKMNAAGFFATAGSGSVTFTAETKPTENIALNYFIVRGE